MSSYLFLVFRGFLNIVIECETKNKTVRNIQVLLGGKFEMDIRSGYFMFFKKDFDICDGWSIASNFRCRQSSVSNVQFVIEIEFPSVNRKETGES